MIRLRTSSGSFDFTFLAAISFSNHFAPAAEKELYAFKTFSTLRFGFLFDLPVRAVRL
jgi:hypothetical protein